MSGYPWLPMRQLLPTALPWIGVSRLMKNCFLTAQSYRMGACLLIGIFGLVKTNVDGSFLGSPSCTRLESPTNRVQLGSAMMPHGLQIAFGHVYAILYA
jgi:hypothetical protein